VSAKIEVFDCPQQSPEWYAAKMGVPSASNFADVLAGGAGKTRSVYMRKLAGELVSGEPREEYSNNAMNRGNAMEPELRAMWQVISGKEPTQVGFIKRKIRGGFAGCSPDALVEKEGILEIKSAAPHILIELLEADRVPPEHLPQCQGALFVTGRKYCELVVGYRGMPPLHKIIKRDETFIARLALGLEVFNDELNAMVKRIRNYGKR